MKKNILIIGFGDIAKRLTNNLNKDIYNIYGVSRQDKENKNFIKWDWLSKELPSLDNIDFESIVFIPKPSSSSERGYKDGFINSIKNIQKLLSTISFNKFISISSTRIYGKDKDRVFNELDDPKPNDYRGRIISIYEENQIQNYGDKLLILRFSGLYNSDSINIPKNHLHRENAAKIIQFFIENNFNNSSHEIFNCSEDSNNLSNISNEKIKELGFIFDQYH
jgi:NAD dependent epimerase/dehydratase family enzyme